MLITYISEKPKVLFIKSLNSIRSHYEIGKNYTFEFYITGYPLPNVIWTYKKCTTYPNCAESYAETIVIFCKNIILKIHENNNFLVFYLTFLGHQKRNITSV